MSIELLDQLADKFTISDECWLWTAGIDGRGYGQLHVPGTRKKLRAHRVMYELLVGSIPGGLVLDHLCRVRRCVRPLHLEPVTHRENGRRGLRGELTTHCPQGHAYTIENTYIGVRASGAQFRRCKICAKAVASS